MNNSNLIKDEKCYIREYNHLNHSTHTTIIKLAKAEEIPKHILKVSRALA